MSRLKQKPGKSGIASSFISRSRALKRLQLSLSDFRRLCILKGIYPRAPSNLKKVLKAAPGKGGSDQTFYATKDIQFLLHEPLLDKFREARAWERKVRRWRAKGDLKGRDLSGPQYTLDHLIRERYPRFTDALADLDDALTMIALFATLPTPELKGVDKRSVASTSVKVEVVRSCARLMREWEAYVMASGSLQCSFISIRGIYYRALVHDQPVTWIVPHDRPIRVPSDVDFRVMLSFLEIWNTLMEFVNYRLFASMGWEYPLKMMSQGTDGNGPASEQAAVATPAAATTTATAADQEAKGVLTLAQLPRSRRTASMPSRSRSLPTPAPKSFPSSSFGSAARPPPTPWPFSSSRWGAGLAGPRPSRRAPRSTASRTRTLRTRSSTARRSPGPCSPTGSTCSPSGSLTA